MKVTTAGPATPELRTEIKARRDRALTAAAQVATRASSDLAASVELDDHLDDARRYGDLLEQLAGPVYVRSDEAVYRPDGARSFFADLANGLGRGDAEARDHLARHGEQTREARALREFEARTEFEAEARRRGWGIESRANMNLTAGTGGEFGLPAWLAELTPQIPRAGRGLAELCPRIPLPGGVMSINVPRPTAGGAVAIQSPGGSVQQTDMTTSSVTSTVATIAGKQIVSQQLYDAASFFEHTTPAALDLVMFTDLLGAYDDQLDSQLLNGSGSSGQLLGLRNVAGIGTTAYTDASPTAQEFLVKAAGAASTLATNRKRRAQVAIAHPRRWYWFAAALDSQNRPLVDPTCTPGVEDDPAAPVGAWASVPVLVTPNVPTNIGAGTNEDVVILTRPADTVLLEGAPQFQALPKSKGDTLEVTLRLYTYVAFLSGLYPTATNVVSGTGLVAPTF